MYFCSVFVKIWFLAKSSDNLYALCISVPRPSQHHSTLYIHQSTHLTLHLTCSYGHLFPLWESQNFRKHCQKYRIFITWKILGHPAPPYRTWKETGTQIFKTQTIGTFPVKIGTNGIHNTEVLCALSHYLLTTSRIAPLIGHGHFTPYFF
jgi:hypothetical protein